MPAPVADCGHPRYIPFTEVADDHTVTLFVLWTADGGVRWRYNIEWRVTHEQIA
jgi:hypothetical protein